MCSYRLSARLLSASGHWLLAGHIHVSRPERHDRVVLGMEDVTVDAAEVGAKQDTDVDAEDLTIFLNCLSGQGILAQTDCAD